MNLEGYKNCKYFGALPVKDVYSYIKSADLGMCTLYPTENYKESIYDNTLEKEQLKLEEKDEEIKIEFLKEVKSVAIKAGNAVNIKFATIDVAVTHDKKVLVMEINASVCMNKFSEIVPGGFDIAKNVYAKAVDKMFE